MKKKMKTNQDGGSVTAKDPAAAGKQLAADQKNAAGPGRMGYSQKFGPGRMNGYDAGAKKTMDVMTYGGASKYMAEGPGQAKPGDRARATDYRERGAYTHTAAVDGNLPQSQTEFGSNSRGPCGGPGQRPCGTNELSHAERAVVNDGDMNNYLSRQVSNTPEGRGFQARMESTLETNRARQRQRDSSYVVSRANRNTLNFNRDFSTSTMASGIGGWQKGNVIGRVNPVDLNTGFITDNQKAVDPNTGSMTKSKTNKPLKKV